MGNIQIKQKKCSANLNGEETEDDKICDNSPIVYVVKLAALIWILSAIYILFVIISKLLYGLLYVMKYLSFKNSSGDDLDNDELTDNELEPESFLNYFGIIVEALSYFIYPALVIFVALGIIFIVLYIVCLIINFLKPFLPLLLPIIPLGTLLAIIILIFDPICCALWETGVFVLIEGLLQGKFREVFTLTNIRKLSDSEEESSDVSFLNKLSDLCYLSSSNEINCSKSEIMNVLGQMSSNIDSSFDINFEDSSNADLNLQFDDELKKIEYENCVNTYQPESDVDDTTAYALNKLHEIKCYSKSISVGIKSYNDGETQCEKPQKSKISKGVENIAPAKSDLDKNISQMQTELKKSCNIEMSFGGDDENSATDSSEKVDDSSLNGYIESKIKDIKCKFNI